MAEKLVIILIGFKFAGVLNSLDLKLWNICQEFYILLFTCLQVLEYVGRGKSLIDVGLAQAKTAIGTRNHYFEIEIVDPGASCYIAIGLARKDYPKNRHPGWNKGSIAYHADDGKVSLAIFYVVLCSLKTHP